MNKIYRYSLITGLLFFTQANSWAAETPEKIVIDADYMKLNIETGFSEYTGNVQITQGQLKLVGDKVTVQQNKKEVQQITVTGKPAHYNHVTEKGENIQAESEHMVYTASQNKLIMTVNARLKQPDHQVSSQKIVYDTEKKIVIAGDKSGSSASKTSSGKNQRVNITLTPKKDPAKK